MIICGVKISHDGGVAVIDGNRLVFSTEMEKIDNNARYSDLGDLDRVPEILRAGGIDPAEVDRFVVDGWYPPDDDSVPLVMTRLGGKPVSVSVAPYVPAADSPDPLRRRLFGGISGSALEHGYASYTHASNHLMGAYATSPFAARNEDALVLTWDGLMLPWLSKVDPVRRRVVRLGPVLPLIGNAFAGFCMNLTPFRHDFSGTRDADLLRHQLEVPGKAMAYAALGAVRPDVYSVFDKLIAESNVVSAYAAHALGKAVAGRRDELFPGLSSADLIATFQGYLGRLLVDGLARVLRRGIGGPRPRLCVAGGCALNIKWNSMIRDSGLVGEMWIPPFPNDSGAAIGTAVCEMVQESRSWALDWDVYSGPSLDSASVPVGWDARPCDERGLAELLHVQGDPIVVLYGRAELGPRALGNRSILAPAVDPRMKDRLNELKGRESYRPVAPVCLQSRAAEVFEPGSADPYMLFEHRLRPGWAERIPAVVHLDGSARLQTIEPSTAGTATGRILAEYERLSGIPVLCNTSANLNGRGFFASAAAATRWGRTRNVWADGTLYTDPA